jgi:hypothetical protein
VSEGEDGSCSSSEEAGIRWWRDGRRGGSVGEEGRGRREGENWGLCARSGLSARRSGRGGGTAVGRTAGGKTPETVLLRSITFAPTVAEAGAGRLRFQSGAVSCVSERDGRGHVGGGVERGAGRGRWSGRGAVRREKELGMRRSRSGVTLMVDLSGLVGLAVRSMLPCLVAARAGVGRGRREGGAVGDTASVAEWARMAGRDGAGACTTSGGWRGGGGIDSGRVRGVGRGRRDGPAMPAGAYARVGGGDTGPPCVYWNPIDCSRPYIRRPSCSACMAFCSVGRGAYVRCSSYAIVLAKLTILVKNSPPTHLRHHVVHLQIHTNTPIRISSLLQKIHPRVHLRTGLVSEIPSPLYHPVAFLLVFRKDAPPLPIDRARVHKMLHNWFAYSISFRFRDRPSRSSCRTPITPIMTCRTSVLWHSDE